MVFQKYIYFIIFLQFCCFSYGQKFQFSAVSEASRGKKAPFTIANSSENEQLLRASNISVKRTTSSFIYFTTTLSKMDSLYAAGSIADFHFEYAPPAALDDTARKMHRVNQVHDGLAPLPQGYTGKDVILGVVDQGLDHTHPDFIDLQGDSRVIRYWDHSISNPTQVPSPYNYGQVWYASQINNGTITSNEESSGHGTSVTGKAAGNGLANGTNKGMAPETDIIVVETNFNLPNWTLTVADACDYIFSVADSLGKPAVINLSVGSYLGSHDGKDPAGALISTLLNEKNGRIVVAAAGNSGNKQPYHARQSMTPADTNFIWFENNPSGTFGNNTVFFDVWADTSDADFEYALGANQPGPDYANRATTVFRQAQNNMGTTVYDTLRNANNDRIATLEIYTEYEADNFHMQVFFSQVDSTNYRMRFSTTGSGMYDLWSGEFIGLNKIVSAVPSAQDYPPIVNYVLPDNAQSIVSSWNCAPEVVSVGNLRGRLGHIDKNGNQYYPSDMTTPGKIAPSSSRGPNRMGQVKPDISAAGDVTLGSGPTWMLNDPAYNGVVDSGGYHVRNGGTSMAAPTVAGIAALYLEKCNQASWSDFMADLQATAKSDNQTGITPNLRYGDGKVDAFKLMKESNGGLQIVGDTALCQVPVELSTNLPLSNYNWSNGATTSQITVTQPDTVFVTGQNMQNCDVISDTMIIVQGSPLPNSSIAQVENSLVASAAPNYQWFLNDSPLVGDTFQVVYPDTVGFYSVAVAGEDGCKSFSPAFEWTLSLGEEQSGELRLFPNPTNGVVHLNFERGTLEKITLHSLRGKVVHNERVEGKEWSTNLSGYAPGIYLLKVQTNEGNFQRKILLR